MSLSDTRLRELLAAQELVLEPAPQDAQIQSCSIDVHLDDTLLVYTAKAVPGPGPLRPIDFREAVDISGRYTEAAAEGYTLRPGHFVLGSLREYLVLPPYLEADVDGRSTVGRCGLVVHATAGFLDPGYYGYVTLEIGNISQTPIILAKGMRIAQLRVQAVDGVVARPYGHAALGSKYRGPRGKRGPVAPDLTRKL